MNEATKAEFQFERFQIPQFSFVEPPNTHNTLDLKFKPSGFYNLPEGVFNVFIDFEVLSYAEDNSDEKTVLNCMFVGTFLFPNRPPFEELPNFFYTNSLAIIFPYLRSFVSTMTLQANLKLLILPLMNLVNLSEELKKNSALAEGKTERSRENLAAKLYFKAPLINGAFFRCKLLYHCLISLIPNYHSLYVGDNCHVFENLRVNDNCRKTVQV